MKKTIAIIHFNTPELTESCILSIRKHGGKDYRVVVFDNSDQRPFRVQMPGVEVIDNTQGQLIDFDKLLAAFPQRNMSIGCAKGCDFASVRHMRTVQELWRLLPDGFVLVESDVLIKKPIDEFFREEYSFVAYVQRHQPHNPFGIGRILPMLCWLNVPKFVTEGVQYFDPNRTYGLKAERNERTNWYDTGASLLEDVLSHRPRLKGLHIDIRDYVEHFGSGSWKNNNLKAQADWLKQHRKLWEQTPRDKGIKDVAICAIGRNENRYAVEWVEHYKKLGVKKIFVYDNWRTGDTEKLADVLQPYVKSKLVEITDCHDRDRYQCLAYEDCYRKHGSEYAWIGFVDFDEFLRWDGKKKIATMFAQYDADVVMVNWRLMTDNGLVHYDDRPLAERFTEAMEKDKPVKYSWAENKHIKSFVRGGLRGLKFSPHFPQNKGLRCVNPSNQRVKNQAFTEIDWSVMRLDHYWTKTAEEWMDVKLSRGYPSPTTYLDKFMQQQANYFFAVNERTVEKEAIVCGKPKE